MYDIVGKRRITGKYGEARPYYKNGHTHGGIDIAYYNNEPFGSSHGGKVQYIGFDPNGYGNYIDIISDDGKIKSRYGHANKLLVNVGDVIKEGQTLGLAGSTGRATGPHVHNEVFYNGKRINPMDLKNYIEAVVENKAIEDDAIKKAMQLLPKNSVLNDESIINAAAEDYARSYGGSPEMEALKKETLQSVLDKLQTPVAQPKEVTISDILQGQNFTDRLGLFSEYLKSPQAKRNMGNLFGTSLFNEKTGRFESTGERLGREEEARLNAEKQRAMEQEKMQTGLASNAFRAINEVDAEQLRNDRELARLQQNQDQFIQTLEANKEANQIKREDKQIEREEKAAQQAIENDIKEKELKLKEKELKLKEEEKQKKTDDLSDIEQQLKNFEAMFDKVPNKLRGSTEGVLRRKMGLASTNEANFDAQRTLLFNQIARKLGGEKGVLSDQDIKRIEKALPTLSDSYSQRKAKMKAVYDLLEVKKGNNATNTSRNADPLGIRK